MRIDWKEILEKVKEFWQKLTKKTKILLLSVGAGILALIIIVTIILSATANSDYRVLFPGMADEESAEVYATLQEMGVQPIIDGSGQIMVLNSEWDQLVFELNAQGYPKTTLSYDTFTSASGFTSTEFEKKTALIFQAQDRMQQTLMRQDGIADATVTFTVPESSNYIWDQSNQQESSAGVTVTMKPGHELTPERVSAIKHLASTSVPKLDPDNVVVVDAATGVEMPGADDPQASGYYSVQRLSFERELSKQIEDNVKRLLSGRYGPDGVTAVATVAVDYDKMVSETKQYYSQDGTNAGVINHYDEAYSLDGAVAAEGIVGEEDNTDTPPIYPNSDGTGNASATDYQRNIDYDVSYVLTQLEKGEPILEKASVAVIVNDPAFSVEVEETLVSLISKAVNITTDNIKVTNLNFSIDEPTEPAEPDGLLSTRIILLIALGTLLLLLIIGIVVFLLVRRSKKRRQEAYLAQMEEEERQRQLDVEREIAEHKRLLQSEALAQTNPKESAITEEVRDFAEQNPEITASLLRSLIREEQ